MRLQSYENIENQNNIVTELINELEIAVYPEGKILVKT